MKQDQAMEQHMTIEDIAHIEKVSHWTVREWLAVGKLKCLRRGKNVVRITHEQYERFKQVSW